MATSEVELLKEMATGLEARLTEALEEAEAQASRGMGIHPIFMSRRKANGGLQGDAGGAWRSGHPGLDYQHRKSACHPGPGSSRQAALFSKLVAGNVGRKILGRDNAAALYWRETCAALNVFGTDDEPPGTRTSDWATSM